MDLLSTVRTARLQILARVVVQEHLLSGLMVFGCVTDMIQVVSFISSPTSWTVFVYNGQQFRYYELYFSSKQVAESTAQAKFLQDTQRTQSVNIQNMAEALIKVVNKLNP